MSPRRLAIALLVTGAALLAPSAASAAPATCPSFSVLHDDRIGALQVPAGSYEITTLDSSRLSCAAAADAFRRFLDDFDGKLPAPWKLDAASSTFTGAGGAAFRIARTAAPSGGGQHPATGALCPGVFRVLQNDWIGTFSIPKGDYTLSLLSIGPMTCGQATSRFSAFLQDWDGRLPSPWLLDPVTGTFMKSSIYVGFRIAPAVTPLPGPVTPTRGTRCTGTFRVQHNDRIGALKLPKGRYTITRTGSGAPTCAASTKAFARFLARPSGRLPKPWKLNTASATFTNGSAGFRVKAVR